MGRQDNIFEFVLWVCDLERPPGTQGFSHQQEPTKKNKHSHPCHHILSPRKNQPCPPVKKPSERLEALRVPPVLGERGKTPCYEEGSPSNRKAETAYPEKHRLPAVRQQTMERFFSFAPDGCERERTPPPEEYYSAKRPPSNPPDQKDFSSPSSSSEVRKEERMAEGTSSQHQSRHSGLLESVAYRL